MARKSVGPQGLWGFKSPLPHHLYSRSTCAAKEQDTRAGGRFYQTRMALLEKHAK